MESKITPISAAKEFAKKYDKDQVCPDYDNDCKDMSIEKATWCYTGCQGHKCNPNPNSSRGTAKGYCPLLHTTN